MSHGKYYPTSHVELLFDVESYPIGGDEEIYDVFNRYAAINLVLHYLTGFFEANNMLYCSAWLFNEIIDDYMVAKYTKDKLGNILPISSTMGKLTREYPFGFDRNSYGSYINKKRELVQAPFNEVRLSYKDSFPYGFILFNGEKDIKLDTLSIPFSNQEGLVLDDGIEEYLISSLTSYDNNIPEGVALEENSDNYSLLKYKNTLDDYTNQEGLIVNDKVLSEAEDYEEGENGIYVSINL